MRNVIFVFLLFAFSANLFSQQEGAENESMIENYIEEITASTDQELDYTQIYEDLTYYLDNPLNLNEATEDDLEKLYILTDYQIKGILFHREKYGNFLTVYELIHLGGFNQNIVKLIYPFIRVEKVGPFLPYKPLNALKHGKNQIFLRYQQNLEESKGYSPATDEELAENPNARYLGSPQKLYARYKFNYKSYLNWGITAEKDPGEEFFKGTQKNGFDYYSAHFFARKMGPIKSLAIGDYHAQFGQGLVLFTGFGYGKSTMVLDVRKRAQGLKPYGGSDENLFFRGAATTLQYKKMELTFLFSHKDKDANITLIDSLTGNSEEVSSLQSSGLHRTPNELADKKGITETVWGSHLQFSSKKFKIGITGMTFEYSSDIVKTTAPYNLYAFSGNVGSSMGFDYQTAIRDVTLFGETAMSQNNAWATVNGGIVSLGPQMSVSLVHRYYQKEYQGLFASAFGENSTVSNEKGFYMGTVIYPIAKVRISTYYDLYSFPWLKFGVNAPSKGNDFVFQADYGLSRYVNIYVRYKNETKPENIASDDLSGNAVKGISDVNTQKLRFHVSYKLSRTVEFRNRMEWVKYTRTSEPEYGFLIYHDAQYKPQRIPFVFSVRFAIFDTDTWDSRLYAYENDVLYSFSIPAYNDKGTRMYFNMKYAINKYFDVWFRISQTYYSNLTVISSGLDEIKGHNKTEAKVQLRFRF